jgi:hypothetical protein
MLPGPMSRSLAISCRQVWPTLDDATNAIADERGQPESMTRVVHLAFWLLYKGAWSLGITIGPRRT